MKDEWRSLMGSSGTQLRQGAGEGIGPSDAGVLRVSMLCAWSVVGLGVIVLIGWALDLPAAHSAVPGWISMQPATAIGLILGGIALLLHVRHKVIPQIVVTLGMMTLAGISLWQNVSGSDFGFDLLLFVRQVLPFAGRMGDLSALELLIFGAVLTLGIMRPVRAAASVLATFGQMIALVGLTGYILGAQWLSSFGPPQGMAVHTSVGFVVLFSGYFLAHPQRGWVRLLLSPLSGGMVARRLLPVVLALPLVTGAGVKVFYGNGEPDVPLAIAISILVAVLWLIVGWIASQLDAIDRRRLAAESDLLAAERKFHAAQEVSPFGWVMLEAVRDAGRVVDFVCTYVNKAAAPWMGRPGGSGEGCVFCGASRDAQLFRDCVAVVETGHLLERDFELVRDGKSRWFVVMGAKFGDGLVVSFLDTTDRKLGEVRLAEAQRRAEESFALLDTVIESIPDPVFAKDLMGRYIVANTPTAQLLNRHREDVLGQLDADLMPPEQAEYLRADDRQVIESGATAVIEERIFDAKKESVEVFLATKSPLRNITGDVVGVVGLGRNITERARMEERLRAAKEEAERVGMQFRTLADNIPQLAWMATPDGQVFWFNKRWYEYTGGTPEEMSGWGWQKAHHREHLDRVRQTWEHSRETEEPWEATFPLRGEDGQYRWFLSRALPVRDDDSRVVMWFGTNTDVTEQLAAEEALKRAKDQAEAASRSKSTFLAAASHDLRQPVQAMVLLISVLTNRLKGHPAESIVGKLAMSLDALQSLLEGLLDVSRLDAGVVVPSPAVVPVCDLLQRLDSEYSLRAANKGLVFKTVPSSVWIETDPTLLERILRNLIENALRYTDAGRILVGCRRRGEKLLLEVIDTGIGIPPEKQRLIFQEFYQVGNPERDRSHGLGLGLSIVQRLAELLGNRLVVSSTPGKGSLFAVEVPMRPEAVGAGLAKSEICGDCTGTALVIDDEAMIRQGLEQLLAEWGCDVVTAEDADEAVRWVRESGGTPAIIIADYRLREGKTGTDAVAAVRSACGTEVPAIILTGDTAPERIAEVEQSGHHIAHKPVVPEKLRAMIDQVRLRPVKNDKGAHDGAPLVH